VSAVGALAVGVPLVSAFAVLLFFLVAKELTGKNSVALAACLMLGAALSYTLYTSGVTKEAFASPLYFGLILLFLRRHDKRSLLLFSVLSVVLAMTHHFTAFFVTIVLVALSVAFLVGKKSVGQGGNSGVSNFVFVGVHLFITVVYFLVFASPQFNSSFTSSMLLTVVAYQVVFVALGLWVVFGPKKPSVKQVFVRFGVALVVGFWVVYTVLYTCTLSGAFWFYALPLVVGLPLVVFGLLELYRRESWLVAPFFWLVSVLSFTGYTVFANLPGASDYTWRSMNFILPPLLVLVALGAYRLVVLPKRVGFRRFVRPLAVLLILVVVGVNAYGMYRTVSVQDSSLGYFWVYHKSDFAASGWVAMHSANQTVAGDARVDYLLGEYYGVPVSVYQGLRYLGGEGVAPEMLYIYSQMYEAGKGYVFGGIPVGLPANWTSQLCDYNVVYVNNEVVVYAKR